MRSVVRRMGNSSGIIIPKPLLTEIGVKAGDEVEIAARDGHLVISSVPAHPRAGWAEASRLIGAEELGEDDKAWLAFGNEGDEDLSW